MKQNEFKKLTESVRRLGEAHDIHSSLNKSEIDDIIKKAKKGDEIAQYDLGVMYDEGDEVGESAPKAIKWYKLAANQGHYDAQYRIGQMYEDGDGIPVSIKQAIKWYTLAAEQDHAQAQLALGQLYYHDMENDDEALKWLTRAAKQGHGPAKDSLKTIKGFINNANKGIKESRRPTRSRRISESQKRSAMKVRRSLSETRRSTMRIGQINENYNDMNNERVELFNIICDEYFDGELDLLEFISRIRNVTQYDKTGASWAALVKTWILAGGGLRAVVPIFITANDIENAITDGRLDAAAVISDLIKAMEIKTIKRTMRDMGISFPISESRRPTRSRRR